MTAYLRILLAELHSSASKIISAPIVGQEPGDQINCLMWIAQMAVHLYQR